jgi:hypothetical protein
MNSTSLEVFHFRFQLRPNGFDIVPNTFTSFLNFVRLVPRWKGTPHSLDPEDRSDKFSGLVQYIPDQLKIL